MIGVGSDEVFVERYDLWRPTPYHLQQPSAGTGPVTEKREELAGAHERRAPMRCSEKETCC